MSVLSAIASATPTIAGLAGAGTSIGNFLQQSQNLKYQKQMQQQTWQREDNAVQRRALDLEQAGLSKTLAAGSSAQSSSPIQTHAPQFDGQGITKAQNAMALLQQKKQIEKTEAEKKLLDLSYARDARDLEIIKGNLSGQRSDLKGSITEILNAVNTGLQLITDKGASAVVKGGLQSLIPSKQESTSTKIPTKTTLDSSQPKTYPKSKYWNGKMYSSIEDAIQAYNSQYDRYLKSIGEKPL